jgi:uncharacterized protein
VPCSLLSVDLRIPLALTLKDKRQVIRHLLDTSRERFQVAAYEVDHQDLVQRALLGFAAVGATHHHVDEVLDTVERYIWSHPEVEVIEASRSWVEED